MGKATVTFAVGGSHLPEGTMMVQGARVQVSLDLVQGLRSDADALRLVSKLAEETQGFIRERLPELLRTLSSEGVEVEQPAEPLQVR